MLSPDDVRLDPGGIQNYDAPKVFESGRVTAYKTGPKVGEIEKAEMTFSDAGASGAVLNYNLTYVDWLGLPMEIYGVGGGCTAEDHTTGCFATSNDVLSGCPETFLLQDDKCISPRSYCLAGENMESEFCHSLDTAIAACTDCPDGTTPEVFACSGAYAASPMWCAALNRGMVGDPNNSDQSLYYRNPPYNSYTKWVHEVCPNIYAFSYDDWLAQGGFRSCTGTELRITFCPAG